MHADALTIKTGRGSVVGRGEMTKKRRRKEGGGEKGDPEYLETHLRTLRV